MLSFFTAIILYCNLIHYKIVTTIKHPTPTHQIILKADDLVSYSSNVEKINEFIKKEDIKISWGIIGNSLENADKDYLNFLKNNSKSKNYHFFNHGYSHLCGVPNIISEFQESYDIQYKHIKQTQNIVKNKTGIILDTIGAPCNSFDENTMTAIEKFPEIKYWYYGLDKFNGTNIRRTIDVENGVGNPDFKFFKKNYDEHKNDELLTLQIHPNLWNNNHYLNFKVTIAFLKSQGYEFITPNDIRKVSK